jgi:D-3-phosphoglycerate dehydrogenase
MMKTCLIVQPIHESGIAQLKAGGLDVRFATATDPATLARLSADCVAVITRSAGFPAEAIAAAPLLRVIGVHGTGTDPVALDAATEAGIPVVNTPGANARSVAEHAIALVFALAKALPGADRAVRGHDAAFKYEMSVSELHGKTIGLIGFGAIGQEVARIAGALGLRTLAYGPSRPDHKFDAVGALRAPSIELVLRESDIISLHVPLTPQTRVLIGRDALRMMKPGAFLINTARGALVDEMALAEALQAGVIAGAGLDVFSGDGLPADHPLLRQPRAIFSPHMAGSTEAALMRTAEAVASQVLEVLRGSKPAFLVNPEVWERRRRQ